MLNEKSDDVESALLYPSMEERPELRWAFIRKVYSILTVQLLATISVAATVVAYRPIAIFFISWGGLAVYVGLIITIIIVTILLAYNWNKHPLNFFLLGIFTACYGLVIGLIASFISGIIILEAASTTAAVVVSLTIYTFWAAKKGDDLGFGRPFLLSALVTLIAYIVFLIFLPRGRFSHMIYSATAVLIFSAYIILDTTLLIKRHTYDQYIWASLRLYLDVVTLFLQLLRIFRASNRR